jgi:dTDP-4-dehydrorhamnose 3,5-epimerase
MKFIKIPLEGAYLVEIDPHVDERGFFARTWCRDEALSHALNPNVVQCSISMNNKRGTLRGLHYQDEPFPETKWVRCNAGAIYDVIVDLRPASPTHTRWFGAELTADNHKMLYVPEGFAHGFQTLTDTAEVAYQISELYRPEYARGVRYNDPRFGIKWPISDPVISARDLSFPDYLL